MPLFVHEFVNYSNPAPEYQNVDNGWWEYDPELGKVYNRNGGWHMYCHHPMEEIIESTWSEIFKKTLRDDSLKTGWISPDGEWFGCAAQAHALFAEEYLESYEEKLEEQGWVKVTEIPYFLRHMDPNTFAEPYEYCNTSEFLTEAQKITLLNHNISLHPWDE